MLTAVLVALSVLGSSGSVDDRCAAGRWAQVVRDTEIRIVHEEPLRVPRDALGTKYEPTCVRLVFTVDTKGVATEIRIGISSVNRALDRGAIETLKKYRFLPGKPDDLHGASALVFRIE